jgi:hypothetical protein
MLETIEVYQLDWNPITVEGYNENKNEITMVFNCDITTESKSQDVIKYVIGRTIWCYQNFPSKATIILSFDIRGQGIIITKSSIFKAKLLEMIGSLDIDGQILIDFLR